MAAVSQADPRDERTVDAMIQVLGVVDPGRMMTMHEMIRVLERLAHAQDPELIRRAAAIYWRQRNGGAA